MYRRKYKQENNCVNVAQLVCYLNFFCGEADHTQCLCHNFPIILVAYSADSGTVSLRKKTKQLNSLTSSGESVTYPPHSAP